MIHSKKGTMSVVQALLLFLAVTIVLFIFFMMVLPFFQEESDKDLCKVSVMGKYGGKAMTLGTSESGIALQCYTQTVTIRDSGVYKVGKGRKEREVEPFPSYAFAGLKNKADINNERIEIVKRAIANEMFDCWDQFFQGKLSIYTSGKRCVVCSEITFDTNWLDVDRLGTAEVAKKEYIFNLGEYINTQKFNKEQTYSDYFGGKFEPGFTVNTRVNTKIVFKSVAQSWLNKWVDLLVFGCAMGTAGIAGGVVAAAYQDTESPVARGVIAAGALAPIPGGGCVLGLVVGGITAAVEGSTWVPSMVTGASGLVAAECDRLY